MLWIEKSENTYGGVQSLSEDLNGAHLIAKQTQILTLISDPTVSKQNQTPV